MTETPQAAHLIVYQDHQGEYRWKATAGNQEPVADSGEGYKHHADCLTAAASLFPDTPITDTTVPPH